MAGSNGRDPEEKGKQATRAVVDRIKEVMDEHDYEPSATLDKEMPVRYEPGFIEAHRQDPDFWDKHSEKVLRMASYAAAFACFLVERRVDRRALAGKYPQVGLDEWLMAMGMVRSACLVRRTDKGPPRPDPLGIPCNQENFPITAEIKSQIAYAFADILSDLMVGDPVRVR